MTEVDPVKLMKQEVGKARSPCTIRFNCGLGTGSTTAYTIQFLGDRKSGEIKILLCPHHFRQKYWLSSTASL